MNKLFIAVLLTITLINYEPPKVQLSGEWVATIYSHDLIGKHHGAYWNGFKCKDIEGKPLSDRITETDLALAMPGAEFYCLPILICYKTCTRAIATDVPKEHRIEDEHGKVYNHIDLYPELAKELGIKGIQWGGVKVFVEAK